MVFPYCHECKGTKDLCRLGRCPLLDEVRSKVQPMTAEGRSVEGPSPPSIFIGSFGYPDLTIGPMASPNPIPIPERLEKDSFLFEREIDEVYSIRSSLVRGKFKVNAKAAGKGPGLDPVVEVERKLQTRGRKILSSLQELSMSTKNLDTQMELTKDLKNLDPMSVDAITKPMGPSVDLRRMRLLENARVPNMVERAVSDIDARAVDIAGELYRNGLPEDHLVRLFSVGMLGDGRRRKLVPTRWSITAMDDTLSLQLKDRIMDHPHIDRYLLFEGNRYGNHFLIALFPPPFRYEMLEQWQKGSLWGGGDIAIDHEGPRGRKNYASSITGAYYAARLSVLEYLDRIRRCGGISVIRWITNEYWAPLGVWVIRETVRRTMMTQPREFEDMSSLISGIDTLCGMKGWKERTVYLTGKEDTSLERFV